MVSYKLLENFKIKSLLDKAIKKVNSAKINNPKILSDEEKSAVKNILSKKIDLSDEQQEWLLGGEYENYDYKKKLFELDKIEDQYNYYYYLTKIRQIRNECVSYLSFASIIALPIIVLLFISSFKQSSVKCLIGGISFLVLYLAFLFFLVKNRIFLNISKKLKDDKLVEIEGNPYKVKILYSITSKPNSCATIYLIKLYFKINNEKVHLLYVCDGNHLVNRNIFDFINISRKIKIELMNENLRISYFEKSKIIDKDKNNLDSKIHKIIKNNCR